MQTDNGPVPSGVKHLPYKIDPSANRFHYYENLWKRVGFDLLRNHYSVSGKSVLDYGCGRGEALEIYSKAGMLPTGTDTDPECVRLAAQWGKSVLLQPEDPVAQFGRKSFDVVTCFHVLEHVPSPVKTLSELSQIARDYLVLAVPNLRVLYWTFKRQFDLALVNEGHLQSWDHWHFRNLAERHCGLELVEWGSDVTILPFFSETINRFLGNRASIAVETGLFRKIFPYHCLSVLGLFRPKN